MSVDADTLINSLFEMPEQKALPVETHTGTTMRVEYYDNGPNPARPKTQFGVLFDYNDSKERWNYNSHIINAVDLIEMHEGVKTTEAQRKNLWAMLKFLDDNDWLEDPNVHVMLGKHTKTNGAKVTVRSGKKDFDLCTGAVYVDNGAHHPTVYLFINDELLKFESKQWKSTPQSTSQEKRAELRF